MGKLIVANWKMQLTHTEALTWLSEDYPTVRLLAESSSHELVICPSFTELNYAVETYPDDPWGAQNCCACTRGPYTGEVSAISLAELGIHYTIVGHSERRQYYDETDEDVGLKAYALFSQGIIPIICIGETEEERENYKNVLRRQLEEITYTFKHFEAPLRPIIAYEPAWAIGSGITPHKKELQEVLDYIRDCTSEYNPLILYGGSVNQQIATQFSSFVDGFMIGSASLNSELLKKIILSC